MRRISFYGLMVTLFMVILSGCLTVEKKEYTFKMTGPNTGKLTIKYINILSTMDDTTDVSSDDFEELLSNYLYGESIETDYPEATNIEKRLFEENGVLCAEVTMEFTNLESVKLFRYQDAGPYMLNIGSFLDTETYLESNGDYGGENMPVVFWPDKAEKLALTTTVTQPDETTVSLLGHYQDWKENK